MTFRAVKVLRGYYEDSGEDAFLMQYRILNDTGPDDADDQWHGEKEPNSDGIDCNGDY